MAPGENRSVAWGCPSCPLLGHIACLVSVSALTVDLLSNKNMRPEKGSTVPAFPGGVTEGTGVFDFITLITFFSEGSCIFLLF